MATLGTTDAFGIDDLAGIKNVTEEIEAAYGLPPVYIHADTAMGGMYSFLTDTISPAIRCILKMRCLRRLPATNNISAFAPGGQLGL
ncbi:hypothetical protein PO124_25190 [Bacillus licheniformis]|nr:hypothetical protein [Bacillus licheniformis]